MALYIMHFKNLVVILAIINTMEIISINIMLIDIYIRNMIMKMKVSAIILIILFIQGCALAPGMQLETERKIVIT